MCDQKVGKDLSANLTSQMSISKPSSSLLKLKTVSSEDLFGVAKEIGIEHDGLLYRLRITKQGKLILNK